MIRQWCLTPTPFGVRILMTLYALTERLASLKGTDVSVAEVK